MMSKITSVIFIFLLTAFQGARADNLELLDMLQQEHLIPSSQKPVVQEEIKTSPALTAQPQNIEAPKTVTKASAPVKKLPKKAKAKHKKSDQRIHSTLDVQPKSVPATLGADLIVTGKELPKSDFETPHASNNLPEAVKTEAILTEPAAIPVTAKADPKPAAPVTQKVHQVKKSHQQSDRKKQTAKKERPVEKTTVKVQEVKSAEKPVMTTTPEVKNVEVKNVAQN
ncbi:hypothetical protein [Rahnella woolbedingensis]|uniref:Uncharacterized protein n=1 Tax=Rahnella woolbedingensis TaxID=1510574 RepID=A0A419N989_9GAMM|nr:hypothetical protein [Rahnella woolbedingensis]RJT44334.1 hypothetical protein D6C13_11335 [Rahnella woolbedingensis]